MSSNSAGNSCQCIICLVKMHVITKCFTRFRDLGWLNLVSAAELIWDTTCFGNDVNEEDDEFRDLLAELCDLLDRRAREKPHAGQS